MCIDTLIQQLCCTHRLDQAQWAALLRGAGAQEAEHLAQAAQAEAVARFGKKIYVRGLIEFTAGMTAITAASAAAMQTRSATGSHRKIFSPAAPKGMIWAFALSCSKAARTPAFPTICSAEQWKQSKNAGATVHLPSPWANATGASINPFSMLARTVICCAMKRRMKPTTTACTLPHCLWHAARSASGH